MGSISAFQPVSISAIFVDSWSANYLDKTACDSTGTRQSAVGVTGTQPD
jgi:hypothetical protein